MANPLFRTSYECFVNSLLCYQSCNTYFLYDSFESFDFKLHCCHRPSQQSHYHPQLPQILQHHLHPLPVKLQLHFRLYLQLLQACLRLHPNHLLRQLILRQLIHHNFLEIIPDVTTGRPTASPEPSSSPSRFPTVSVFPFKRPSEYPTYSHAPSTSGAPTSTFLPSEVPSLSAMPSETTFPSSTPSLSNIPSSALSEKALWVFCGKY
mmetsp:Transcript_6424/g.9872  ORF Transcript_6424/g.9872 Transcript_6424/m.9872 type:complete len:207 (-) Transcript_6424:791-1411(-)